MTQIQVGTLYIVPTPLGNLKDITLRAVEILKNSDVILAEDTRHSKKLLGHYGINASLISLHDFNERELCANIINRILQGETMSLISDAGTPLISDPGYHLVREAIAANIKLVPLPGPCAAITALSASGLASDKFHFEGFLPAKEGARNAALEKLKVISATLIFYEAPHRILSTLKSMKVIFGEQRQASLAREMTKTFETFLRGSLAYIAEQVNEDTNQQKGEIVLLVEGNRETPQNDMEIDTLLTTLLEYIPLKKAVEVVSKITGINKNPIYDLALLIQNKNHPNDKA